MLELFPVVFQEKKILHVDPFTGPIWQAKTVSEIVKLLDCGRKIQNDVHIDTYYCKPELIS